MAKQYLKGLDQVLKNLNKEADKIEGNTLKGLIRAGILVRRDMDNTSPKIPVDTGNLRSSYFLVTSEGDVKSGSPTDDYQMINPVKIGPFIVLGFSANYAVFVHEMVTAKNWNRSGSGAKFLENALDRNAAQILYTLAKEAQIK